MQYKIFIRLALPSLFSVPLLCAPPVMRPGLWEHSVDIKSKSGQIEKAMKQMDQQMASLPPEQRKMMEEMMAAQGVSKTPQSNTVKTCLSKKDAELNIVPQTDKRCSQQVIRRSGNSVWFKFSCSGNPPSSGEGTYTFSGNTAYKGKMSVRTTAEGHTEIVNMNQHGKWLSDDCGKLKVSQQN